MCDGTYCRTLFANEWRDLVDKDEWDKAEILAKKEIENYPRFGLTYFYLALCHEHKENFEEAIVNFSLCMDVHIGGCRSVKAYLGRERVLEKLKWKIMKM